jgi:hypothetical protein
VADFYKLQVQHSLLIIVSMLTISILASLIVKRKSLVPAEDFTRQEANGRWRSLFRIRATKKKAIGS